MTGFTEGPWEISHQNGDPEESFNGIIGPTQTNRLGKLYRTYVAQYVMPQNAHLIAAAPDLYEALEALMKAYSEVIREYKGVDVGSCGDVAYDVAGAALAKARGES